MLVSHRSKRCFLSQHCIPLSQANQVQRVVQPPSHRQLPPLWSELAHIPSPLEMSEPVHNFSIQRCKNLFQDDGVPFHRVALPCHNCEYSDRLAQRCPRRFQGTNQCLILSPVKMTDPDVSLYY